MDNEYCNNNMKVYFIKMDELKDKFHDAICQGEDWQVVEQALQASVPYHQ